MQTDEAYFHEERLNEKERYLSHHSKEMVAGVVGAVAQVFTGQPFDIIKVRMQTATSSTPSVGMIMKDIVKYEGVKGFYKGTTSPLVGSSAIVPAGFVTNGLMKRFFTEQNKKDSSITNPYDLHFGQFLLSGAAAGVSLAIISTPVEHMRIRCQIQSSHKAKAFTSPKDALFKIYNRFGIKGVYHGFGATLARESLGGAFYFGVYESLKSYYYPVRSDGTRDHASVAFVMASGGMAGATYWTLAYPIDLVKSQIQADSLAHRKIRSLWHSLRLVVKSQGVKALYRGYSPALMRCLPANGALFVGYELAMKLMHDI